MATNDSIEPEWLDSAPHWYYSHIVSDSVVRVCRALPDQEVSDLRPGELILQLRTRRRRTTIYDVDKADHGSIRSEGFMAGLRFVMRRGGAPVWVLTVRSFVRKRHRLEICGGDEWIFDTPFYWWQHLTGTVGQREGLRGGLGPTTRHWGFCVDTQRESADILAAVAFMHWKWWQW